MQAIYGMFLFFGMAAAFAQGVPPPQNLPNPASFGTKEACLLDCDQVFGGL